MKQTLSKWTQLHSSGGGKSRLLHLALMLICMLATAQAGWAQTTLLSEDFSKCTGTGGNDGSFDTAAADLTTITASTLTTYFTDAITGIGDNANFKAASGCLLQTGSSKVLTLKTISKDSFTGGKGTLTVKVAGWQGSNTASQLKVKTDKATITEQGQASSKTNSDLTSATAPQKGSWTTYTFNITNVTGDLTITIKTNYAYIDDINVATESSSSDETPPTLSNSTPTGNNVAIADGNATITFSENVIINDASKFTIDKGATLTTASASVNNKVVTIPYTGLANGTTYTITIGAEAVKDAAGNKNAEITYTFTTVAAATTYNVTQTSTTNGSFTVTPASATEGTMITVTTSPDSGYEVNAVTLSTGGSVTKAAENSYTFSMPASAVEVTVTFKETAASTSGTATFDYSASGANATSWTQSPITVATNSTGIDGSKHYLKTGNSNADDLELTISGANITKVVVHYQSTSYLPTTITANDGTDVTTTGTTSTWVNATGTNELILTLKGNKRRVTKIDVTYGESVATYDIHYNTVNHGELSGAAKAAAGARVTVTAEPDENYGLSTLTIYKYDDDSDITSSCNVSGNKFTMPAYAVKVGGTFALLPTITRTFESTQGNVTTSPETNAAPGTMVTINANAKSGYSVGTITVKDDDNNNITVTDNQFTMPNSNVTVTVTFNAAAVSAGDKWNFITMTEADKAAYEADGTKWNTTDNSSYYYSKFSTSSKNEQTAVISTTIQQIKDLKFVRTDGGALSAGKVRIYLPTSTDDGYLNFDTSNGGIVLPSMAAGTLITVDFNGGGSSYGILPTNATTEGGADITSVIKSATRTTTTFKVKTTGEVIITGNNSKVKFYKITVGEAVNVAEPSFSKADGDGYNGTPDPLSVTVTTEQTATSPATATTYWAFATTALDRDAIVAADNGFITKTATATITKADVNEQTIVLSAVTKYETGDNIYYSDVVTASYPYTGTKTLGFNVANMNVPVGGQQTFAPTFTYKDGTEFDPEEDTANPDLQNIYDYFDFTFTQTGNTNVPQENLRLVEGGVVIAKAEGTDGAKASVGSELTVDISAQRKTGITSWPFDKDTYTVTGVKATVVERGESGTHMDFWWDPTFTNHVEKGTDWNPGTGNDASVSIFSTPYPNGRMIYLEVEDGWTAYVAAGLSDKSAKIIKTGKQNEWNKTDKVNYLKYRRNDPTDVYPDVDVPFNGLPLVVDDGDWGSDTQKTFYVNIKTVDANGKEGSPVKARYTIKKDDNYRPAAPSLTPAESNAQRNTAQTVLTQGAEGAYVYGKFGGGYTVPNLVNSEGINGGLTSVGVFSTEVESRQITAVQVGTGLGTSKDNYFYVSPEINNKYKYLFASEISLKSKTYTTNVYNGEGSAETVNVKALIDKITYYNKDSKKDINIADDIQARSGETAEGLTTTEKDRVTYSIERFNGADDTTINDNGVVTIGQNSGYVVVTATYPGGYSKTVSDRTSTTDVSKATYTIYLVNPDEQIPTITPGSRNFVDEQSFIIQAPAAWNALYMVVEKGDANYDAQTATYSTDDPKVGMLEKGEYIRMTVTETSKVRAFAYDPSPIEGQEITTSKEVTATYTKLDPLKAPTLSPYGTSEEPHIRTAKSLTVIATTNDPVAGLEVYYTLDGSDPTPTTGEKYNGSEKINISAASTTIKAITYDPASGRISPVTTGVYMYTGSIKQPKFQVNGTGNYYTSGTITVSPTDKITITSDDGGDIYYTLDGATPTTDDAVPYTTSFTIVKNTTGKAIAVKDDASSPITTVEFELATEKNDLWEAVEETTPGGKLDANDRYVAVGNSGNSSTKAVKFLTATFGGMDAAGWNKTSIGEKTQGSPLDGVGKYSISTTRDVWDETDAEVKNTASTVHGKTFALPAKGNFVRFEPQRDGDLTIWLLQQGGLHYTDDGGFCNQFIRLRPVYMLDERGNSIDATSIMSAARLSDNWNDLDVSDTPNDKGRYGNWVAKNKSQNGVVNKYYDEDQSERIYNMYKSYLTTGENDISSGDPIEPFAITDETVKGYTGIDGTGYVMPSGGNVKYTFRVKGGKSYYFFGYRTKLAIRGFQFTPLNETVAKSVIVEDATSDMVKDIKAGTTGGKIETDEICNVTYKRAFTNGKWAAVTFPFSVSVAQMKEVFGNQVDLIHFDNVSGSKINFKRHWYPMIVAGTPVFIKPSQDMGESVEFKGVRIEAETVNAVGEGGYKMTGSFTAPATINVGDYYISGGKLAVRKGNSIETKACRSWLTKGSNTGARFDLTMGTADAFAEEAWSVIGNPQPFVTSDETVVTYINGVQEDGIINNIFEGPTGIYTINGQLIRKDATSLEGLSKGIYIVNGKKIAVK